MIKKQVTLVSVSFVTAAAISVGTAYLPVYFAVPRILYANIIPTALAAVVCGPLYGAAYALINSFILNSIGMGSGVIVNVLLYQMLEAALIGLFFHTKHAKKTYAAIIVYILLFSAFDATLLKAFSYILYYTFHVNMTAGKSLMDYLAYNYSFYLKSGIASNFIVVLFSLTAAVMAGRFIFWLCMEKGGCRETKL